MYIPQCTENGVPSKQFYTTEQLNLLNQLYKIRIKGLEHSF